MYPAPESRESMDKVPVALVLETAPGRLTTPFLELEVAPQTVPGFLWAVGNLCRYLPIRAVIDGNVAVALELTSESCQVKGQPVKVDER